MPGATAIAGSEMTFADILRSMGLDPAILVAGLSGGALRALSRRRIKVREVLLTPLCGALAAAYLTLPTVHYIQVVGWPVPDEPQPVVLASAFLIGTCAMWISDIVLEMVVRHFKPAEPDA